MFSRKPGMRNRPPLGYKVRTLIHKVTLALHPYVKVVVPNFRRAHYVYIISMSFLVAIICYPISNFRFIDILFLLSGTCTQAGLNTVNLNDLYLLQQIVIYIATTLTTPIFIHGSLLFIRLYWFERHFDNIKESSKLNFKMRRNATLAARTKSNDSTRVNTVTNQGLGFLIRPLQTLHLMSLRMQKEYGTTLYSEPSDNNDDKEAEPVPPEQRTVETRNAIKFGDLPHPSAARRKEIDPSDMFKSIAMLQHNRRDSTVDDDVLVIKSPKEIEKELNGPIFTRKNLSLSSSPRRPSMWKRKGWSLRRSLSNTPAPNEDEPRSPRSPRNSTSRLVDMGYDGDDNDDEDDDDEDVDGDDEQSDGASIRSLYSDEDVIESMDSENDMASNNDITFGGHDRKTKFALEPKINRPNRRRARRRRSGLRKWRTPMTRIISRNSDVLQNDSDDEEHYFSEGGNSLKRSMSTNYLSWEPTIGRNSTFVHLTEDQKEELGGVEYRAIKLLIKIIVLYYIGFHVIAFSFFVGFINVAKSYGRDMEAFGILPTWWGFFTAQSVFNDLGLTLTPNSMATFSRSVYILVISSFFIVIGNTGFPILLRFIIWVMFKFAKPLSLYKESLGFLLDHPRRCFTLLFPSIPTWWLFFILVVLNATDLILFIILDLNSNYLSSIPTGFRVLDGMFQAFSTRTAGFSVIDLSQLHPAVQVSYMIMMYISVLPLAISIRRTNVYEEQSLGIYAPGDESKHDEDSPSNFLSFDLWFIFLGLFIICIAEGNKIDALNIRFTVFTVLFEIISAYGTVGLSLGYPNTDQSFSYKLTTVSKLVIIAMMIRGRHRGLPYTLDRAIMLPDADMKRRDAMQEHHAVQRAQTLDMAPTASTEGIEKDNHKDCKHIQEKLLVPDSD
ncbi:CIC11C00000001478 [Sungouiella intermedia]|uniref:Potassium transport protein n=1 Tax=Sungouiella intermedia TaxID=45354 RepID=A0A1L0DJK2_9ASCO|nr:CIC11C00000001478 [[Candida] intermedia]